jgi:cobalt transporter subunit CbtA
MTIRIFASALFAGLVAGLIAALLQFSLLTSTLLEAERYESGELVHFDAQSHADAAAGDGTVAEDHDHDAHSHDGSEGMARHVKTFAMNLVTTTGYALVLIALFSIAESFGRTITAAEGAIWGICGFAAVMLLPSIGLPPELPGTPAADLAARQVWWVGTVFSAGVGLALILLGRKPSLTGVGLVLLVAPHLIGAPELEHFAGTAPPEMAAKFAARSLAVGAITWLALGFSSALFWERFAVTSPQRAMA